ncbi:MAG: PilZ domain-containing protein [Nitrospira sp.]|nr:PilZ domain-containing protein [Nitrospira sp.]MDH4302542.1 PilZ domain-containing protein [Nitrospira sp.]MDH5193256.1 PilZ domain-containing protein [Nitrospira sp.]
MASPSMTVPSTSHSAEPDDRREWIRIEDRVLMEYRLVTEGGLAVQVDVGHPTAESIAAAVSKPTSDLLARSSETVLDSAVLPWIRKVDYLLEVIVNALAVSQPSSVRMARPMDVNLSGGGIGFVSLRAFNAGDQLAIKLILPPFTLIETVTKVIRAVPQEDGQGYAIATEFVDLKVDDQEHLIRHILQAQSERLRASRHRSSTERV